MYTVGGGGGVGARENRGREAGVLRRREAGEKCEMLIFLIKHCVRILTKTRTKNVFNLHLTSFQSLRRDY